MAWVERLATRDLVAAAADGKSVAVGVGKIFVRLCFGSGGAGFGFGKGDDGLAAEGQGEGGRFRGLSLLGEEAGLQRSLDAVALVEKNISLVRQR